MGIYLIAKEYKMKLLKQLIPYAIFSGTLIGATASDTTPEKNIEFTHKHINLPSGNIDFIKYVPEQEYVLNSKYLDNKADSLCNVYINNALESQQKLKPLIGTRKYRRAVREELPGAPVGLHCLYGQFTHLARALDEMGDTLTVIPEDARMACIVFKNQMREKYSGIQNCIYEGVMHKSDSAYNVALSRYLERNNVTDATPISVKNAHIIKFAQNNFSADAIAPGAILIVPRYRGSRNRFHAIMLLGRGRVENNEFIPDPKGQHIYVGHNRENMGDLFRTYDTSYVFAADTKNIVRDGYKKELEKIESMSNNQLIEYLSDIEKIAKVGLSRDILLHMARNKYFNKPLSFTPMPLYKWMAIKGLNISLDELILSLPKQKLR